MAGELFWGAGMSAGFATGRFGFADYPGDLEIEADVAVIGAGAGGCAAALALSERGLRVAVIEEGRHWRSEDFRPDARFAMRALYQGRGARSMRGNVIMPLPGGRGVGGSTLINSAICYRCPDPILARWRDEIGIDTIDPLAFGARFDRLWSALGVTVQSAEIQRLNNIVFRDGAERLGLNTGFLPRSAPGCSGCGVCQFGCPSGGKASADRTLLREAEAAGSVAVYADCRLVSASRSGDRIVEVSGERIDPSRLEPVGRVRVRADRFVLSGGPIGSPLFLQSNRLSDSAHLGAHLVVHPTVGSLARFPFPIRAWHGVTQGCYVDCWDRGFLLQTYTVTPDQYFLLLPTAVGDETMGAIADLAYFGSAGTLVHDEDSEGHVSMSPVGPDLYYHLGDVDRRRLIEGLRLCGRVFFAAGATAYMPARSGGRPILREADIDTELPLDLPAQHLVTYASHPMGTCRMSATADAGVCDPTGKVWGVANLWVADASLFPTSLGVNPQLTTMALGLMVGGFAAS